MNEQNLSIFSGKNLIYGRSGTTDVSTLVTGLIGLVLTVIFYKIFPLPIMKGSYVYALFVERGQIQYAITLLFFWALVILVFKVLQLMNQQAAFSLNIIPADIKVIRVSDSGKILDNINNLAKAPRENILLNRIWIALEHFRSQGKVEKVDEILQYQGEIDMENMESSYTIFKVFIWAIPILGFIGTVLGIGSAVGGFSDFTKTALEIDQIKTALDVITGGLSVAFDTTLLGLVCALILMLPGTALQKMEGVFLVNIEKFCLENLLNRFQGEVSSTDFMGELSEDKLASRFKAVIEDTFQNYLKMLEDSFQSWSGGFGEVMEGVTGQTKMVGEQFSAFKSTADSFGQAMAGYTSQVKDVSGQQVQMMKELISQVSNIQPLVTNLNEIINSLNEERRNFKEQATNWMQNLDHVGSNITNKIAEQNQQQIDSLNDIRRSLDQDRQAFNEKVLTWMQDLDKVGRSVIEKIGDQQREQTSSQSRELQEVLQTFSNLVSKEGEIISLINKNYEQMSSSDRLFKETLEGILRGLGEIRPALEQLARPKKIRFIEE